MKSSLKKNFPRALAGAIAALIVGTSADSARAATFNWLNQTGSLTDPTKWQEALAPSGLDATDILIFAGDVGTTGLGNTSFIATSNSPNLFFLINQLRFQATSQTPGTGPEDTITGSTPILFGGTNPTITRSGDPTFGASLVINAPVRLGANLTLAGDTVANDAAHDKAMITFNGAVSGNFDIAKNGTSTYRFGSTVATAPSDNTWFGTLTINEGTIRFNNNAYTAPTALRANPVVLNSPTALLTTLFKPLGTAANQDPESSLRMGTLSGMGTVEGRRATLTAGVFDSIDMTITAISSGSFAGALRNIQTGAGSNSGTLNIRGVGTQAFTGTLDLAKDVKVADIATMTIGGNANLGLQTAGAIILGGGTVRLDNASINNPNRLRDGSSGSTGVETIGGGTLSLVGNAAGTTENVARLQLGSAGNSRSGALTLNVTHNAAAAATTVLNFQSYSRDAAGNPYNTVNFTANDGVGGTLALGGGATSGPRITFATTATGGTIFNVNAVIFNGLLGNTGTADATSVGWATVNGTDFASYGANGVTAVIPAGAPPAFTGAGDATVNAAITTGPALSNAGGYALNSLKITPGAAGLALDLATAGTLRTNGILLAGATDYSIDASGGGKIANAGGVSPRYFHVTSAMLTVSAAIDGVQAPIVKAGEGTLVLTSPANSGLTQPVVINAGTLRATPGTSLPGGELRFRGGVLEITGGGTFIRQLGAGANKLNWAGLDTTVFPAQAIGQEQGSGGFAAVGADATVDLSPVAVGGTDFAWEDDGFVNSGHALVFGSTRADAKLTWVDNINLTSFAQVVNYNARQFRAIDNPASTADVAVLSGTISGTLRNDFMKTGNGELVLSGNNTYSGATLITDGTLRVNGSTASSFLTDVRSGGTLGGSGSVAGVQVENGGTIAPGDAAGHASILSTEDLKFTGAGARLTIELGGTTAGGDIAAGYDQVNVTGGITLGGGELTGSLLNGFTAGVADLFFIIVNDESDAVQGTFAQGGTVTIGAQLFDIGYTGNSTANSFTGGNDVVLRLVPEPGTGALLLLGTLGLGIRRRRA